MDRLQEGLSKGKEKPGNSSLTTSNIYLGASPLLTPSSKTTQLTQTLKMSARSVTEKLSSSGEKLVGHCPI